MDEVDISGTPFDGETLYVASHADASAGLGLVDKVMANKDRNIHVENS